MIERFQLRPVSRYSRIKGDLTSQTLSTHARHHCALRLEARIGFSPMIANTGCVWDEGKMRNATQELRVIGVFEADRVSRRCPIMSHKSH
jgi:hypothetical protein